MENSSLIDLIYVNEKSISRELCGDIITLFEQSDHHDGITTKGLNKNVKDTTELLIHPDDPNWTKINKLLTKELLTNVEDYYNNTPILFNQDWSAFGTKSLFLDQVMQIQKYRAKVGKYQYHIDEVINCTNKVVRRITFIWYLNDVKEGGETEFFTKHNITPEAGKLVLFPACWTFPHTGKIPISNDKYIITGWLYQKIND
jgi:hypothetical protein